MESPTRGSTSPERAPSPIREASPVREVSQTEEEEAMETSPVVHYDEDSDSPKDQFPQYSTDKTAPEGSPVFDSKYDSDFEKDLPGSTSPVEEHSHVTGYSPVNEGSNPTWNDGNSDRGSVPPSPKPYEEVTTEDADAAYPDTADDYGTYHSDHQDETLSPVSAEEEGASGKTYGVHDSFDESVPPSPREEGSAGREFSVPSFGDDDSGAGNSSSSPTAGSGTSREEKEETHSAEEETVGMMSLSDVEDDDAADQVLPRTPPRTFSDEGREYGEGSTSKKPYEPITPESMKRSARKQTYSRYNSDESDVDDSEDWGTGSSVRPGRKDSDPFLDKTAAPSAPEDLSGSESDVEREPPASPKAKARPNVPPVEIPEWDSEGYGSYDSYYDEWDSDYTLSPNSPYPASIFGVPVWIWIEWWPYLATVVISRLLEEYALFRGHPLDHTREKISQTKEEVVRAGGKIRKEIRYLQSYKPTLGTAAQEREATQSGAMTLGLFLITFGYIVLISIGCRLFAISSFPFLGRFVF